MPDETTYYVSHQPVGAYDATVDTWGVYHRPTGNLICLLESSNFSNPGEAGEYAAFIANALNHK